MINENNKRFVRIDELSKMTSIPPFTLRKLTRQKRIPGYKINSVYLYDPEEVFDAIKQNGKID